MVIWVQKEVVDQLFGEEQGVSNIAHLSGAIVGTILGFQMHGDRLQEKTERIATMWLNLKKKK